MGFITWNRIYPSSPVATYASFAKKPEWFTTAPVDVIAKVLARASMSVQQIDLFEKELLKQAQETLRIAQFSFQQGAANLLDLLDAQRVYRQIQLDYAQTRYELSVALARLERSTGGHL